MDYVEGYLNALDVKTRNAANNFLPFESVITQVVLVFRASDKERRERLVQVLLGDIN